MVVRHRHLRRRRMMLLYGLTLVQSAVILQCVSASSSPSASSSSSISAKKSNKAYTQYRHNNKQNKEKTVKTILTTRCGAAASPTSSTPNKKYTAAAESAMKTINSLTSSSKSQQPAALPNLLSESALMDKETNAIYWQGGSDIISTSLTKPYLTEKGVLHVRATILSGILWLWVWGKLARYLASTYFESSSSNNGAESTLLGHRQLFQMAFTQHPLLQKVATLVKPVLQFILLLVHSLLYLRLPSYSPKFLITTILLYLIEALSCSTRRYLSHALNAPTEVEDYLERIRIAKPVVKWKVRCFHYEDRLRGLKELGKKVDNVSEKLHDAFDSSSSASSSKSFGDTPPPWMAKKVVTHEAVGTYKFDSCQDQTVASLWKRSQSFKSSAHGAPFSKLALSKLLVLKDRRAREDYFAQQAAFVTLEGRKDVYAEFATSIEVEGFRPKLLAVRPVRKMSHVSAALFRQHIYILFTLLGLSLPYRIWFGKHCDEVKVTILKETGSGLSVAKTEEVEGADNKSSSSWFRWGSKGTSASSAGGLESQRAQEQFRKNMQSFSLYGEEGTPATTVVREVDNQKDMTPPVEEEEPATVDNSELQITRDELQIMQNQTSIADEVAGDVACESSTEEERANSIDEDASINHDVACAEANSTTATSQNKSIESDRNKGDSNDAD